MSKYDPIFEPFLIKKSKAEIEKEIEGILSRNLAAYDDKAHYAKLLSCIDLTSLSSTDNEEKIAAMVEKVNSFDDTFEVLPNVAAICVYPSMVRTVRETLTEEVEIASVAGGFPSSQTLTEIKVAEVALAVADGATEIDIVIPVGKLLAGAFQEIEEEIREIKDTMRGCTLKVILEESILDDPDLIAKAAVLAIRGGADFIKTSTGKEGSVATLVGTYVMCEVVKRYSEKGDGEVGIKCAGGIRTTADAVKYLCLVSTMLKESFVDDGHFRIGASSLANSLLSSLSDREVKYF